MADDILHLHAIAQQLRKRRYAEGSLRLDNVKIGFELDAHGNPIGSSAYAQRHELHPFTQIAIGLIVLVITGIALPSTHAVIAYLYSLDCGSKGSVVLTHQLYALEMKTTELGGSSLLAPFATSQLLVKIC